MNMSLSPTSGSKIDNKGILSNTWWILKINFRILPLLSIARIIGLINNYSSSLVSSFVMGILIDAVLRYASNNALRDGVVSAITIYGIYYVLRGLAAVLRNYGENLTGFKLAYEIPESMLLEKLHSLSTSSLESPEIQNKITRYRENRHVFQNMSGTLYNMIGVVVTFIIGFIPVLINFPLLALLIVVVGIPSLVMNKRFIDKLWKIGKETTVLGRRSGAMVGFLSSPSSLKEIKLLNAYTSLHKYFSEYTTTYYSKRRKAYNEWTIIDLILDLLNGGVIIFGISVIINTAINNQISIGQIAFYIAAINSIGSQLGSFTTYLAEHSGSSQRLDEMRSLLEYKDENRSNNKKILRLNAPPLLELKNVYFKYPNQTKNVLKNLNLNIQPGEKIAIVGENGAGKTTLVKLISNIYPVTIGELLVNGDNLNDIEPSSWFENMGVLYQDYNTYDDLTVLDNIALGQPDEPVNMKAVIDAAKKADAYEFINAYPNKFDQILSERYEGGIRPSTGQWQKIAIARFFYRNAPILILDEPTASIDAVAEANIFNRIYQFIENKTVIIISHRFSTVRNADRIIVMDKGEIVEQGTHKELLTLNGIYANAYNTQAKGYRD